MAGSPTTLFIGVQYLRDNTIINDNVDAQVLQPIIRMAQYKYIQQTIGTDLYSKLITDIDANALTGNYQILVEEYIIPVLTQYCILECLPYLTFKFRNKSISKQNSDNSTPAELDDLMYLRDNISNTAEFFAQRMSKYLCHNSNLFPEYSSNTEDLSPNSRNYFNGIHVPHYRRNWNEWPADGRFGYYEGGYQW